MPDPDSLFPKPTLGCGAFVERSSRAWMGLAICREPQARERSPFLVSWWFPTETGTPAQKGDGSRPETLVLPQGGRPSGGPVECL